MGRNEEFGLSTSRVEALADGIFAFSMTLLVLTINMPEKIPKAEANQVLLQNLISLIPQFLVYALAFIILGSFWGGHQNHFQYIKRVDGFLLWNNILGLMFVALLPFTTNLAGDYGDYQMGILPMEINLLLVSMFFYGEWSYISTRPELLKKEIDASIAMREKEKNAAIIVVFIIAIGLSFFIPSWSPMIYILIPLVHMSGRSRSPK